MSRRGRIILVLVAGGGCLLGETRAGAAVPISDHEISAFSLAATGTLTACDIDGFSRLLAPTANITLVDAGTTRHLDKGAYVALWEQRCRAEALPTSPGGRGFKTYDVRYRTGGSTTTIQWKTTKAYASGTFRQRHFNFAADQRWTVARAGKSGLQATEIYIHTALHDMDHNGRIVSLMESSQGPMAGVVQRIEGKIRALGRLMMGKRSSSER